MAKKHPEELQGKYITDENGVQYFIVGNTRIRVTEYFKEDGPTLTEVLERLIRYKAREEMQKK